MSQATRSPFQPGDSLHGFERVVSQQRIHSYAEASGDFNPIHLDPEFAAQTRFGQRIAHGMLSLAFVWEMIAAEFPKTWMQGANLKVRFTSPVLPGERVQVGGQITRIRGNTLQCKVFVNRPNGEAALEGTASIDITHEE